MKPAERHAWLLAWIKDSIKYHQGPVDILNQEFVEAYAAATNAKIRDV